MELDDITLGDFEAYEGLRLSGLVNMGEVDTISALTDLSVEKVEVIGLNYEVLAKKYNPPCEEDV